MNLDCPGCRSRLKLDPSKLPPGATAAVCPKCRTKILLPGTASTAEISVQCSRCASRLKVKVSKLKQTPSKSKCPKCGNIVDLPAAPASAGAGGAATQILRPPAGPAPGRPGAPPPGVDRSAMTRRLDAREMGVLMQGQGAQGGDPAQSAPISLDEPPAGTFESSTSDLGRLIDEKVEGLGEQGEAPPAPARRIGEPSVEDLDIELPPASGARFARSGAGAAPGPADRAPRSAPAGAPAAPPVRTDDRLAEQAAAPAGARRPGSGSGNRAIPTFSAIASAAPAPGSGPGAFPFVLGGIIGGSLVAAGLILGGRFLPEGFVPPVPEPVAALTRESLGLLALLILLSAISGLLTSFALPPAGEGGEKRVSISRCAIAAGLVGLLAGVGISLIRGGSDLATMSLPTATWTAALVLSGLLTGLVARIFSSR